VNRNVPNAENKFIILKGFSSNLFFSNVLKSSDSPTIIRIIATPVHIIPPTITHQKSSGDLKKINGSRTTPTARMTRQRRVDFSLPNWQQNNECFAQ
jgi:hypothetical protein